MSAPAELDYPNDDEVEAFYNDPYADELVYPTDEQLCILREDYRRAEQLVNLAGLERAEYQARILLDRALDILAEIPDGDMDDDDQAWGSEMYMSWAAVADALSKARRENGMGA